MKKLLIALLGLVLIFGAVEVVDAADVTLTFSVGGAEDTITITSAEVDLVMSYYGEYSSTIDVVDGETGEVTQEANPESKAEWSVRMIRNELWDRLRKALKPKKLAAKNAEVDAEIDSAIPAGD